MKKVTVSLLALALSLLSVGCSDDVDSTNQENIRPGDTTNQEIPDAGNLSDIVECEAGAVLGCADGEALLVCNADGTAAEAQACPADEPHCFQGTCGTQVCTPGVRVCKDERTTHRCMGDGSGFVEETTCPNESLCSEGQCQDSCELGVKMVSSYFGCEYWTVYLDQYDEDALPIGFPGGGSASETPHAVVISNPNDTPATILFQTFGANMNVNVSDPVVPPRSSRAFTMPQVTMDSTGIFRTGIFVRSTVPVTAHQFNPLNNEQIFSNDASLLLPVSALGREYYVMNWPTQVLFGIPGTPMADIESQKSYVTIIAAEQGTTNLNVTSRATIEAGGGINEFPPGVTRGFQLQFGDVLNLHANSGSLSGANDLTGTHIVSDKPIVVFAGHQQAVISYDSDRESCCADHLEQQLLPLETWGQSYIGAFSPGRTNTKDHWRILAGEDGVTVNTVPPQPGANGVTLNAGEFVTFFSDENFEVNATGKISVGQFLAGQGQTNESIGDPAFVLAIPVERFRDDYLVLTPEGYSKDYITVIRPAGVEITLDDSPLSDTAFSPVAGGTWEVGSFEVQPGVHFLESANEEPFGVLAYGLDSAVSYGYPGGLNVVGAEQ